jgi:hypothetical protein
MWQFKERQSGIPRVEPTEKEFFADEDSGQLASSLIRESIQNSLDARMGDSTVKIRLHIDDVFLSDSQFDRLFGQLKEHVVSEGSGIRSASSIIGTNVRYIAIEDFGTTGLTGSQDQDEVPKADESNQFYYFWRHIGRGGKSGSDLGRWGLGKTVFAATSQVGAYFGVTRRKSESDNLAMGLSVLKYHVIDETEFQPFGYFASHRPDGFPAPIVGGQINKDLTDIFQLSRGNEPGLSVVVPFANPEITVDGLRDSILTQFYFPIALGTLEISVSGSNSLIELNSNYLKENIATINREDRSLGSQIELALWFSKQEEEGPIIDPAKFGPDLSPNIVISNQLASIAKNFEEYEPIAVRIPAEITFQDGNSTASYVTVIGKKGAGSRRSRVSFVRQGLTIPSMRVDAPTGTRFLVYAHDKPIAEFLGDAENPAHTTWTRTERIKNKYKKAQGTIEQVKSSVSRFHNLLIDQDDLTDNELLQQFFPAPVKEPEKKKRKRPGNKPGTESGPPIDPPPPNLRRFTVTDIDDGFSIKPGANGAQLPIELVVRVAYDTDGGNPFSTYETFDFQLGVAPIKISTVNCTTRQKNGTMAIDDIQADFEVMVTGFDTERDLITDVRVAK